MRISRLVALAALGYMAHGCGNAAFSGKSGSGKKEPAKATPEAPADDVPVTGSTPAPTPAAVTPPAADEGNDTDAEGGEEELEIDSGKISCEKRKVLIYALQPAGSSPGYEKQGESFAAALKAAGVSASFSNRAQSPALDDKLLKGHEVVVFFSGCGGATGLPSAAELASLKSYYMGGGSLMAVTDDSFGDSSAMGSCHARVNPIANAFGVKFSGLQDNRGHGCAEVEAIDPLMQGLKLGRCTSALMTINGPVAWGTTKPELLWKLKNGAAAEALVRSDGTHGAALFSPDFGSLSCDAVKYLTSVVTNLGCN